MTRRWPALIVCALLLAAPAAAHADRAPVKGTVRNWTSVTYDGSDFVTKDFKLRGVGPNIEVWVALNLPAPSIECRSSNPANLVITDQQVNYLVDQFERVIRPTEARYFGALTPRGGRLVVLVDNIGAGGLTTSFGGADTGRDVLLITAQGWPNDI